MRISLSKLLFTYTLYNIIIKAYVYFQVTVMSWSILEKNALKTFDKANPDLIDRNLDDLDNDFKYLFPTPLLLLHSIDWRGTNNLSAIINRGQ